MRVGIVTIHHVPNYGAVWQAHSLARVVRELGHEIEIVDYRPANALRFYRGRMGLNPWRVLQRLSFQRFVGRELPLGRIRCGNASDLSRATSGYDVLVAGSDQIWCTGEGSFRGYDRNFFLDFRAAGASPRKISYAASCGNTTDFAAHAPEARRALEQFARISVRDEPSRRLIERTLGRSPVVVLDPTLLADFSEFASDIAPTNEVVLFAEQPARFASVARELAAAHRSRIVALGKAHAVADESPRVVSPHGWLRRIAGARVVLTDYFHGAALAIQFGRPLIAAAAPGKQRKVTDLLDRFGLGAFFLGGESFDLRPLQDAMAGPAYAERLQARLQEARAASRAFLSEALLGGIESSRSR